VQYVSISYLTDNLLLFVILIYLFTGQANL